MAATRRLTKGVAMKAIGRLGTAALRVLLPTAEASACTDSWVETRYYCQPGAQDYRCNREGPDPHLYLRA